MFIKIRGVRRCLWRAVDQHGNVLDILIQSKRDGKAATRFFRTLLKRQCHPPRVLIADKLPSCQVSHRTTMSTTEHRQNKYLYLNDPAENSHQPTRQRERVIKGSNRWASPPIPGLVQSYLPALRASPSPYARHRSPHRNAHPISGVGSRHRKGCLTDYSG
ncbi:DDE-type integrase/transposase/recombinase [Rhodococcus qingshengii]|uniref:DDE-type integrase/transposase/recombinase n=1 Tax=Rhodococcus qingshengii TaxID=334542 RepID=UPI0036DA6177